eukprot:maker-scaffold95_size379157-snap-gene-2.35 protein:Tk00600 transcript:maker-scaffold95_size379157-snap-gene-2.35-mRNA-1 annotation:"pre-mrna-splicing factor slu7-like"
MASVSKTPVSRLVAAEEDDDAPGESKKSREEYKKEKALEEARKLGNAEAAVDEEGKDINPHIPQYISDAPWYLDPTGPTLKHQRVQDDRVRTFSSIHEKTQKGINWGQGVATKFRRGACENCGAVTHKKRDCLERPRKIGAKFTGANLAPDEFVPSGLRLDFDGKRDRWHGYDNVDYKEVVQEFSKIEDLKKELKKEKLTEGLGNPEEDDGAPSSDEDEDKYVDKMDMPGTKVDAAERYTVRNLRIREDTAKYLRNLDPNSAHYDPKTRSMRKNPYESTGKTEVEVDYAGDNFVRISGDTVGHAKSQLFAWEAGGKGLDVHALAEPTKLEALKKEYTTKKDTFKEVAKDSILDKYGGHEHLEAPPRELIFAQTEDYVEYTRHGQVLKGEESKVVRSRYEEDVYLNNHTSVWGSYWTEGKWGYQCCHSMVKNSYCTGAAGREANAASNALTMSAPVAEKKPEKEEEDEDEEVEEEDSEAESKK